MYNGIGLTTPRGSGTNGYVVRNLAVLRNHETASERAAAYDALAPPKHREPDSAILEHENLRKVEVECLVLQERLEDEGLEEDEIERQVDALRDRLLAALDKQRLPNAKSLRPSDTHGLAAAKKVELARMAAAFGMKAEYNEGDSFNQERQAELKEERAVARIEADKRKAEQQKLMAEQKLKWEMERKERDRLRRREEDRIRQERLREAGERRRSPSPGRRYRDRAREEHSDGNRRMRSISPRDRDRDRDRERERGRRRDSRSPPGRRSARESRPRSPPRGSRYRRSDSPPPPARRLSSRSPPHRHVSGSRSPAPALDRPSGPGRPKYERSPPDGGRSVEKRKRRGSVSSGSAMSMSSGSDED